MSKILKYRVDPEIAFDQDNLSKFIKAKLSEGQKFKISRRSIDARKSPIKIDLEIEAFGSEEQIPDNVTIAFKDVTNSKKLIIVGSGPAGLFAALKCLELGVKPIIIERGKDVQARRRDLADINKNNIVNPESNYCFGEGGAGTYSDGKLYTRSKKRGDINRVLNLLVQHGAKEEILFDSHPHIGTNKLPKLIQNIRETILSNGGEIYFNEKVVDLIIKNNEISGVKTSNENEFLGESVVLATGHSARDIFELLHKKNITIFAKPFALGVRVEHQQSFIDSAQYHQPKRGEYLPAAYYNLVAQTNYRNVERGVFSFCMCPGGFIVPSATADGEIVVNGMSPSRRDSIYSNSGIVVAIDPKDLNDNSEFACLNFQKKIEHASWLAGGKTQTAPSQLLLDFVQNKNSQKVLDTSYQPGIVSAPLHELLPENIRYRLQNGFKNFGKKMNGYLSNDAQILAVESRTSSPITIPRDRETLEHIEISRLYPCGEGAGYAGGIMSAAIDGEKCAETAILKYKINN